MKEPPDQPARSGLAMNADRTLSWDWYEGVVPENVELEPESYLESTYSFHLFRSRHPQAVRIGRGSSVYLGTMFALAGLGRVVIGEFSLINGARIICDAMVEIGPYCLISWNVVILDNARWPRDRPARRTALERAARAPERRIEAGESARPVRLGRNVWVGFDVCILPGVTIGEGSIVGARSVVESEVPPYTVVAGNPARVIRRLPHEPSEINQTNPTLDS